MPVSVLTSSGISTVWGLSAWSLTPRKKLRIFHDFYRTGEETGFAFDMLLSMRKGHDFKDYICPDTFELEKDYFRIGKNGMGV